MSQQLIKESQIEEAERIAKIVENSEQLKQENDRLQNEIKELK